MQYLIILKSYFPRKEKILLYKLVQSNLDSTISVGPGFFFVLNGFRIIQLGISKIFSVSSMRLKASYTRHIHVEKMLGNA